MNNIKVVLNFVFILFLLIEIISCAQKNSKPIELKNYYTRVEVDELIKKAFKENLIKGMANDNYYSKSDIDKLFNSYLNFDYAVFEFQAEKNSNDLNPKNKRGLFIKRELNKIISLRGESISLDTRNSNIILLPGKYRISGSAPAYSTVHHQLILRNLNTNTTILSGTVEASGINGIQTRSFIEGIIEVKSKNNFQLEHFIGFSDTNAELGIISNSGEKEVFSRVFIQKIN